MVYKDITIYPSEESVKLLKNTDRNEVKLEFSKEGITVNNFLALANKNIFDERSYVHEFLENCEIHFHSPSDEPRNPELEERVEKLKAEQANQEYRKMVGSLLPPDKYSSSFREDVKSVSSQVVAVINFVLTVAGSFFFTYKAVEYALPEQNIPAQVMMGIVTSVVVAIADLYFLIQRTI